MKIYIPPQAGLGAADISVMRRLSRPALQVIADELHEPESHDAIRWILRQRDPERALAEAISENVRQATLHGMDLAGGGMGDLGKSFFKKLAKIHRKVAHVVKKTASKIANKDPLYKLAKPTLKKVAKAVRKNLPIIITVAGAVLAPFTGGASLAAAAALTTARQLYVAKVEADKAKRAGKKEAAAMQAQVDQQEAEVNRQADDIYNQNKEVFLAAGYNDARWHALSLDQKIDLIQKASEGKLVPTADAVSAQQQVVQTASSAAASGAQQAYSGGGGGYGGGSTPYGTPEYGGGDQGDQGQEPQEEQQAPAPTQTQTSAQQAPASKSSDGIMWTLLAVGGGLLVAAGGSKKR